MAVVIICNVGKMIVIGYIAWKRPQEPLVTIGDAVASFLENPDLTTKGNCLAELRRFNKVGATISLSPSEKVLPSRKQNSSGNKDCSFHKSRLQLSLGGFTEHNGTQRDRIAHSGFFVCQLCLEERQNWDEQPIVYEPRRRRWLTAASSSRLLLFTIL